MSNWLFGISRGRPNPSHSPLWGSRDRLATFPHREGGTRSPLRFGEGLGEGSTTAAPKESSTLKSARLILVVALFVSVGCGVFRPLPTPTALPAPTSLPTLALTSRPIAATATLASFSTDPFELVSPDSLLAFTADLTAIQPYSGWRNSGTQGEQEALDYVASRLDEWQYLHSLGLELERQEFHVFMATEIWEAQVHLQVNGQMMRAPANGLRGDRDNIALALRFDSDGKLNDQARNPVTLDAAAVLIRTADELVNRPDSDMEGKIVFLDYAVIDRAVLGKAKAAENATNLLEKKPAGVVLVTQFSNKQGVSHGVFVGDVSVMNTQETEPAPPTLYARLEDLAVAGINTWSDLEHVQAAQMMWDADVFSPATSGNLIARIPGADPSRAIILGAHIDSPNSPGALDNGSGSAILLEIARILNETKIQPPTDLYLAWFGSEELGLYGSNHFAATHQELLDKTVAMLQIDALSYPLDGISARLELETWSYGKLGNPRLTWPNYLQKLAARQDISVTPANGYYAASDNGAFGGFDVPNANLIYLNNAEMELAGGIHNASHFHDPYDTIELAQKQSALFEQMARVALAAALYPADAAQLKVTPLPDRRAVFIASHTEAVHLAPTTFTELGMALAMEGFDVDMIPYGQPVTPDDLNDADIAIALPVLDYPNADGETLSLYDEAWSQEEIAAMENYVADGGLLVLTNTAFRFKYSSTLLDPNEDWSDMNALAGRFGIVYTEGKSNARSVNPEGDSPLTKGLGYLWLSGGSVPLTIESGQVLAQSGKIVLAAMVDHGQQGGQVLALADVAMMSYSGETANNLDFWRNLARYARR